MSRLIIELLGCYKFLYVSLSLSKIQFSTPTDFLSVEHLEIF